MDRSTCSICADYLSISDCTACPCGHTFHYNCILRWKKESATCPQCRVKFKEPIRLFFEQNVNDTIDECDASQLKNQIRDLKCTIAQKDVSLNTVKEQFSSIQNVLQNKEKEITTLGKQYQNSQGTVDALKRQLQYLDRFKVDAQKAKAEAASLETQLISYKNISELIKGERHDVEEMINNYADTPEAMKVISNSYILLKKEFDKMKDSKRKLETEKKQLRRKAESASTEAYDSKQQVDTLASDLTHLNEINKGLQAKLKKLEQAFSSPSPRSSAIKRFMMESPAPMDLKRQCLMHNASHVIADEQEQQANNGSLILFDGPNNYNEEEDDDEEIKEVKSTTPPVSPSFIDMVDDEDKQLIDQFGIKCVSTTSIVKRDPLKDINKNSTIFVNNKYSVKNTKQTMKHDKASSDLPRLKRGFNGMGGQSKVLYIPKRTSGFKKPASTSTVKTESSTTRKLKIPKNNMKISKYFEQK